MSKHSSIQFLFKQLKSGLDDHATLEQKKYLEKLNLIYRDLNENVKQLGIQNNESFFDSLRIRLYSLKKDILNNNKTSISDYQAFLWKYELYKNNKEMFVYIPRKQITQKITVPQRAISSISKSNLLNELKSLSFCPLGYSINEIISFSQEILLSNPYCKKNFSKDIISQFLNQISREYRIVSYHNFTHAFSVQLMLFQCLSTSSKLKGLYSDFQAFISYVSALAHDMGHYGTNSDFQVKSKSQIANLYSNQSVLENMHLATFCKMLRKNTQIDIISQIKDPVERQRSKRLIMKFILGTDVSRHFQGLNKLKQITGQFNGIQNKQKQIIQENLFHACDIGNCCLPNDDFMNWALLLSYEFNSQYELQIRQNLQPTQMFKYQGEKSFYRSQIGFIDFLAAPLWRCIGDIFPELKVYCQGIDQNREKLQNLLEIPDLQSKLRC